MLKLIVRLQNAMSREDGQGMAEYALVLTGIAVVVVAAAFGGLGPAIAGKFGDIATAIG